MHDVMGSIAEFLSSAAGYAWGLPFIFMLVGAGAYFTLRLGFIQLRRLKHAFQVASGRYDNPDDPGDITHFQALSAALSATVGTGNIAGVATALHFGGPGALFWMWVSGLAGMATKYATCTLGLKYRRIHADGSISGGPMYYIRRGLGRRFQWLAVLFALSGAVASFGGGNMVQSNSMARAFDDEFGPHLPLALTQTIQLSADGEHTTSPLKIILGLAIAIAVGSVILGGIRRIGLVAARLVPTMAALYVFGALAIILMNAARVPAAFAQIFEAAFNPTAASGGFLGATVVQTVTWGVRRAVFSNEAGLGSAPIAHAAAKTREPVREGVIAMVGPLVDTLIICTLTGLVIVLSGLWTDASLNGEVLTKAAFKGLLPAGLSWFGGMVVAVGLILFAVSTAISWSYYGDRCVEFLFGERWLAAYRWIFVVMLFIGANVRLSMAWDFADLTLALMAFWNLVGLMALSGVVIRETGTYFSRTHEPYR